jgi:hypothetical protein
MCITSTFYTHSSVILQQAQIPHLELRSSGLLTVSDPHFLIFLAWTTGDALYEADLARPKSCHQSTPAAILEFASRRLKRPIQRLECSIWFPYISFFSYYNQ